MSNGEVTNAELARRLDRIDDHLASFEKHFDEDISRLRHRDNNLDTRITANTEQIKAQAQDIGELKATVNKLIWAGIGAMGLILINAGLFIANLATQK